MTEATRRAVVFGASGAGLTAVLTACGAYGSTAGGTSADDADSANEPASGQSKSEKGGGSGRALAQTSDIPEGGGKIFADKKIVVTQPAAGEFKAFSTTCTHAGCPVDSIADGTINCPCHGSKFSIADGSVKDGPAPSPLPAKKIKVSGDTISLA